MFCIGKVVQPKPLTWAGYLMNRFCSSVLLLFATSAAVLPVWAGEAIPPATKASPLVVVDRVRFYPAPGHERDMLGGKFC
jgi:hypothetical protein